MSGEYTDKCIENHTEPGTSFGAWWSRILPTEEARDGAMGVLPPQPCLWAFCATKSHFVKVLQATISLTRGLEKAGLAAANRLELVRVTPTRA